MYNISMTIEQTMVKAIEHFNHNQLREAEHLLRSILAQVPDDPDANHNLGILAMRVNNPKAALPLFEKALRANPKHPQYRQSLAIAKAKLNPTPVSNQHDIDNKLAALFNQKKHKEAMKLAKQAVQDDPDYAFGWKVIGTIESYAQDNENALRHLEKALELNPYDAQTNNNLGNLLRDLGKPDESEVRCREAVRLVPNFSEAHNNLGNALNDLGRLDEAEASYGKAISLNPHNASAHNNLGSTLRRLGKLEASEARCREAIRLEPNFSEAHNNLGNALNGLGRLKEAEASYREAIRLNPGFAEAHSNLLFNLNYVESLPVETALKEAKRYGSAVSARAVPKFTSWHRHVDANKLRIGFVSGDLKYHPVGYFVEGLIRHMDKNRFDLIAFPTATESDALTVRIKPFFLEWLPIYGKNDVDAATLIHNKEIDILIDLSGHTAHNRLPVFSYKPAPIQVTWPGYFATTGLPEMDYFLGDPYRSPDAEQHHFTEKVWNFPETRLCFTPPNESIAISSLPARQNGYITFGNFGNLTKMGESVIKLWAAVLQRVPHSKLFLKDRQFSDAKIIERVQNQFINQGIGKERLMLEGPSPRTDYLKTYNRIDMVLDTFPYPGGTTSIEALWMGVPVLTLKGDRFLSRMGESIAHNSGNPDWIAVDQDDYVNKAVTYASDIERLARVHQTLRDKVLQTPLFDAERFAKNFENILQDIIRTGPIKKV